MKKLALLLLGIISVSIVTAQAPGMMTFQSVVRDTAGDLLINANIGMKISILQGSASGTAEYVETHAASTNANGLVSLQIGAGVATTDPIDSIDWANGPYFLKTEIDPNGGTTYTISGTNQLLSVPYALYAAAGTQGPAGPQGPQGPQGPPGSGGNISCSTSSNSGYVVRGDGSGGYECSNALRVMGNSSTGYVGINTTPSSTFDLKVAGNIGIGFSPSSSYELAVDGDAYFEDYVGINTTPSSSYELKVNGNVGIGTSPSSSFELSVSGDGHVSSGLSVGTTSTISSGVKSTAFHLTSSTSGSGTNVIRTSGGLLRPQSSTIRVKDNVQDLVVDKEKFLQLRARSFNLKPALGGDADIGLIAEEVEELVPELVVYGPKREWIGETGLVQLNDDGTEKLDTLQLEPYSVRYDKVGVLLVQVVAEQEETIKQQQGEIDELKERLARLESFLEAKAD